MKTSELQGAQLDYWVARAEGVPAEKLEISEGAVWSESPSGLWGELCYQDWAQGGPLIDKYGFDLSLDEGNGAWCAASGNTPRPAMGSTPLQAVCRAVVRAVFGDEVPNA